MSSAVQMSAFVLISIASGSFLVRQYRAATPEQRRPMALAAGVAVFVTAAGMVFLALR